MQRNWGNAEGGSGDEKVKDFGQKAVIACGLQREIAKIDSDKPPKVDRTVFEDVVSGLLHQQPMKRSEIKSDAKKPARIIPPKLAK